MTVTLCLEVDEESVSIVFEGVKVTVQPIDSSIGLVYGMCHFMMNMPNYIRPCLIECGLMPSGLGTNSPAFTPHARCNMYVAQVEQPLL